MSASTPNSTLTVDTVEEALGRPLGDLRLQCHAASLALVQSGLLGDRARVARGILSGIDGQHSWAVVGDPYRPERIVDITAWSYNVQRQGMTVPRVWEPAPHRGDWPGFADHIPHGTGPVLGAGYPVCQDGDTIPLEGLSADAQGFVDLVARLNDRDGLDIHGWAGLLASPVGGWPAGEIMAAAHKHQRLAAFVHVDRLGMLTDINPGGLYF